MIDIIAYKKAREALTKGVSLESSLNKYIEDLIQVQADLETKESIKDSTTKINQAVKNSKEYTDLETTKVKSEANIYTDGQISMIPPVDLSDYTTNTNVDDKITNVKREVNEYTDKEVVIAKAESKDYTNEQIKLIPEVDLSEYDKSTEIDIKLSETKDIVNAYTNSQIEAIDFPDTDLTDYETIIGAQDKVDKSLVESKSYTDNKVDSIEIPEVDLSEYDTIINVDKKLDTNLNISHEYTDSKIDEFIVSGGGEVDLSGYDTSLEVNSKINTSLRDAKQHTNTKVSGILIESKEYTDSKIIAERRLNEIRYINHNKLEEVVKERIDTKTISERERNNLLYIKPNTLNAGLDKAKLYTDNKIKSIDLDAYETTEDAEVRVNSALIESKEYTNTKIDEINISGSPNLTQDSLTLGNYRLFYNKIDNSLDIEVLK